MDFLSFQEISTEGVFSVLDPLADYIPLFAESVEGVVDVPLLQEVDVPLEYLSMDTVKELLGRSERTIRRYVREGYIQAKYKTVDGHRRVYYTNRSVLAVKLLIENKPNFRYHGTTVEWFCKELLKIFYDYYREVMKIERKNCERKNENFIAFMRQEINSL